MPRGDRTGPMGYGPGTGRGAGFCAGFDVPGYMNGGPRRHLRRGFGRGPGRGFARGYGRGFFNPYGNVNSTPLTEEEVIKNEINYLENLASGLEQELKQVKDRLDELKEE